MVGELWVDFESVIENLKSVMKISDEVIQGFAACRAGWMRIGDGETIAVKQVDVGVARCVEGQGLTTQIRYTNVYVTDNHRFSGAVGQCGVKFVKKVGEIQRIWRTVKREQS